MKVLSVVHNRFKADEIFGGKDYKEKGQSLIEVIAALTVAMLVILALVWVTTLSIRNTNFSKNKALATKYASEEMEDVRIDRDTLPWDGQGSFWSRVGSSEGPSQISGTDFRKTITYENEETGSGKEDQVKVTVVVSWTDAQGTHQSELVSYFSKWQ